MKYLHKTLIHNLNIINDDKRPNQCEAILLSTTVISFIFTYKLHVNPILFFQNYYNPKIKLNSLSFYSINTCEFP